MHKGIVKEGILGVMQIQWQSMFKNYRQRIRNTANSVA
jgi:dolichol-phosphate mannosyltransferase